MSEFEDRQQAIDTAKAEATHPPGWTPGMDYSPTAGGNLTVKSQFDLTDPALWEEIIKDWGLDPMLTEIEPDSIQIRSWDMNVGQGKIVRAKYYKCKIRPRRAAMTLEDIDQLTELVMRRGSRQQIIADMNIDDHVGFVVNLSDFQIGKGEGGGTPVTVQRITNALHDAYARFRWLRMAGHNIAAVFIVGLGDLAEQCFGHYPSQQFTVDCTRRRQLQIVRELITLAIDLFVDDVERIVVGAVPGNHGENRLNGKSATTVSDNDDLAVFEQVSEALAKNPARYSHVEFEISDDLVLTLDVCGTEIGWTHMHQGAGSGEKKIADWWRGQVMGNRPISSAQILNTAHFHHFLCSESTGRTIMQMPAMDGGSGWWTDKTGQNSPPGMVTYLAGKACGQRGWSDLLILEGS